MDSIVYSLMKLQFGILQSFAELIIMTLMKDISNMRIHISILADKNYDSVSHFSTDVGKG